MSAPLELDPRVIEWAGLFGRHRSRRCGSRSGHRIISFNLGPRTAPMARTGFTGRFSRGLRKRGQR